MIFKDLNFKISVVERLHRKGCYCQEVQEIKKNNRNWNQHYVPIPAVLEFYKNLEIEQKYLDGIEGFSPDGGDSCYEYLFNVWDGEDDQRDISSIVGIENFTNLKTFSPISMIHQNKLDFTLLLLCRNLEEVG